MKTLCTVGIMSLIILGVGSLHAADYYVAQGGQTPGDFSAWGTAASNIQEAVNVAVAGDTVWVGPGTYKLPPVFGEHAGDSNVVDMPLPIHLRSLSGNPADTIIDGEGIYRCVWMGALAAQTEPYILDGFTITNGYSDSGCGGIYVYQGGNTKDVTVQNCLVADNLGYKSGNSGPCGGLLVSWIYNQNIDVSLTVSNCTFRNNETNAIYAYTYCTNDTFKTLIVDCLFENNIGSGAYISGVKPTLAVRNCIFRGNDNPVAYGAGLYAGRSSTIQNCLFYNNRHLKAYAPPPASPNTYGGAAIYLQGTGTNYIENCTVVSNYCTSGGKAISQHFNVQIAHMKNTLVYFNRDDTYGDTINADMSLAGVQGATYTNCLTRSTTIPGEGNISKAPEFIDMNGGDCRLWPFSSGVDQGREYPWMATATDVAGNPRISANGLPDIGCYERTREPRPIHYVAQNGQTPLAPYTNLIYAASNIQDAVEAVPSTDIEIVEVAPGRYTLPPGATVYAGTNIVYIDRAMTLRSSTGDPADVVLDGEGKYRGVAGIYSGRGRIEIDGLTLSNCLATTAGGGLLFHDPVNGYVAGIGWTNTVKNCVFQGNTVHYGPAVGLMAEGACGGGIGQICRTGSSVTISNCIFRSNMATNELADPANAGGLGGALYSGLAYGPCEVKDSVMQSNVAYRGASGFLTGTKYFENCVIADGILRPTGGQSFGGGIFTSSGNAIFRGCLMYGNDSGGRGGAINNEMQGSNGVCDVYNCTIVNNARGIYIRNWAVAQNYMPALHVYNSIVYSNGTGWSGNFYLDVLPAGYTNTAVNSCYPTNDPPHNLLWDDTCITNYPEFQDYAGRDFHLKVTSPCIDKGLTLPGMETQFDLDGRARLDNQGGQVDMGCYEYSYVGTTIFIR